MEQLVRVRDNDFEELDQYLDMGYKIKQISACMTNSSFYRTVCYVALSTE